MADELRYFSPVKGKVVRRYGTKGVIGAVLTKTGYEWDEEAVVAIPITSIRPYLKEYNRALKGVRGGGPSLIERTKADFDRYVSLQSRSSSVEDESREIPTEELVAEMTKEAEVKKRKKRSSAERSGGEE